MEVIQKYFPNLTEQQRQQFEALDALYRDWNAKINVISRKDIDNLYTHHILHSLALAKIFQFNAGATVMDLGTGGGIPGLPLAILFPQTAFWLVDSIGKKVRVATEIADAIGLKNITGKHSRAEELKQKFDFVITRGVSSMTQLLQWTQKSFKKKHLHGMPNGIWAYKGQGERLDGEFKELSKDEYAETYNIKDIFEEPFFETKSIIYLQS